MHSDLLIARSLTWRYVLALALVAMLTTAAWLSLHLVISEQNSTAAVVNISGRQRMLSQRTALFSSLLVNSPPERRPAVRSKLREAADLMRKSHQGLIHGNAEMGLPATMSATVRAMYFAPPMKLDEQVSDYLSNVDALLQAPDVELRPDNPLLQSVIAAAPANLVRSLDRMVGQYQLEGEAAIGRLQVAETIVWMITVLLLVLEAAFIFKPFATHIRVVIRKLQEATEGLRRSHDELEDRIRERTRDLEQRTNELAESEEKFRLISASAQDAIIIIDGDEAICYWNPAATTMFGYPAEQALGRNMHELLAPPRYRQDIAAGFARFCQSGSGPVVGRTTEITALRRDGQEFPIELSASVLHLEGRLHALGIVRDISERKRMEDELRQLAATDPLTGVANRRRLLERMEVEWDRFKRFGVPTAVLMVDIDHFKKVNDTYGHAIGDVVLRHFTTLAGQCLRHIDLLGRLGGEEFCIILPGTDSVVARQVAERCRHLLASTPAQTDKGPIPFTVSMGISEYDKSDVSVESSLGRADISLYRAKRNGRNKVELFALHFDSGTPPDDDRAFARLLWKPQYDCGEPTIDQEHRRLFGLANVLLDRVADRRNDPGAFDAAFDILLSHVAQHFANEEGILRAHGYSRLDEHIECHRRLVERARNLRRQADQSGVSINDLLGFLISDVVAGHMLPEDWNFFGLFGAVEPPALGTGDDAAVS